MTQLWISTQDLETAATDHMRQGTVLNVVMKDALILRIGSAMHAEEKWTIEK